MFSSILKESLTIDTFAFCIISSLVLGLIISFLHMKTSKSGANFVTTLAILPALVASVILMVNGNLGTSVAVLGAFSLIRFRSIPGNSKEILNVFFAMAIGLACGTGYLGYALLFTIFVSIFSYILYLIKFGEGKANEKILKIVIPENLDYTEVFDDIFSKYLKSYDLINAKTTNMGSMFELTYNVRLNANINEKALLDEVRCRNGNLKVALSHNLIGEEL